VRRNRLPAPVVTRFAPAPTGHLHLGHVVNAIYVWGLADSGALDGRDPGPTRECSSGVVLLRIEDHDRQRSRRAYERAILEDLEWLGFVAGAGAVPLVRQSERGALYAAALDRLRTRGLAYACACSRSGAGGGRYPGTCGDRGLREGPGLGIRVRLEPAIERFDDRRHGPQEQRPSEQCGDLLARDRHGNWTYQFAVVVDDLLQGVTAVIRGDDLLESTGRQIQLARLLGRTAPPAFLHHPLVMKTATQKLSKSDRDSGVRDLRARGWSADRVIGQAAASVGLIDEPRPLRIGDLRELVVSSLEF
jgi:glutamyl/glutaminyl-tRNA synthetase